MKKLAHYALLLATCVLVAFSTRVARAQVGGGLGSMPRHFPHAAATPPPSPAGPAHIRITVDDGARGPVVLEPRNGGYIGEFVVWNDGPGPLTVSRVAMRGDEDDPRLPPRFTARFADGGGGSSVILPHSSKRVRITWVPDREPKLHEALGHVVLTSNDEAAGEVAMGFVVPLEGPLSFFTAHLLTWLLFLPLFGAFVALAMHIVGYKDDERLRGVVVGLTAFQLLLAILLFEGFNGTVTRVDGNDGFQFIERVVLLRSASVEYFVGVDGINVSLVLLTAVVGFAASLASYGVTVGRCRYYGLLSLLLAGVMGVFVSLDLSLLAVSWAVMLVALTGLLAPGAPRVWPRAAVKLAVYATISALLLALAVTALYLHSDPTYLADGTRAGHTFALPELMRVAYNAKHLTLLGFSWVKVVWVALFIAFAILIPLVPLHGWFIDLISDAPAPVSAVLAGVVMNTGVYGLLRVSFGIFPDGSRWAATTLVAAGVVTLAFAAMSALRQSDLVKIAAYATVGQAGFSLIGLGGLTREGIAACLIQMFSRGVVMAMLFLLISAVRERVTTANVAELAWLGRRAPVLGVVLSIALLASAGVPGFAGFWGEVVALLGAFPVQRALVVAAAGFGAVTVAYHLRVLARAWAGPAEREGDNAAGEKARDLGGRDFVAIAPLLFLCLALGAWPAPFFELVQGAVSDLNQLVNPPGPDEIARGDVETTGARPVPPAYSRVETSLAIAPSGRSRRG